VQQQDHDEKYRSSEKGKAVQKAAQAKFKVKIKQPYSIPQLGRAGSFVRDCRWLSSSTVNHDLHVVLSDFSMRDLA